MVGVASAVAADDARGKEGTGTDLRFCGIGQHVNGVCALIDVPKVYKPESSDGAELTVTFVLVKPARK